MSMFLGLKGKGKPSAWQLPAAVRKQQKVDKGPTIAVTASPSPCPASSSSHALVPIVTVGPSAGPSLALATAARPDRGASSTELSQMPAIGKSMIAFHHGAPKVAVVGARASPPTTSLSDEDRASLLQEYELDVRTKSAAAATESNWRPLTFYHER